jgi:hypothetical protein
MLVSTAFIVLIATKAVFACTLAENASGDEIVNESLFALRTYHPISLLFTLGIGLLVILRRGRGWYFLILPCILMAISPGWFPMINSGVGASCEPRFAFEMKAILAICAMSLILQMILWLRNRPNILD